VTTYETFASDYRMFVNMSQRKNKTSFSAWKSKYPVIMQINWFRVIFDESHKMQHSSRAIDNICALRRWCVTGTPFNAKMGGITGQFQALGA